MSDAIDNWCCIQGTVLQANTALRAVTYLIFTAEYIKTHNKMNVIECQIVIQKKHTIFQ